MGAVEFGVPVELAADLGRGLGLRAAVETGTYQGQSAMALRRVFPRVFSIDVVPELSAAARERYAGVDGLTFLTGSSADLLAKVVADVGEPALFWLDGHWCEGVPPVEESQCPVLAEIEAIDRSEHGATSCILIDDAHMHVAAPPPPYRREDWPGLADVFDALRARHRRYVTMLDDVIVAGPPGIQPLVDGYWLRRRFEQAKTKEAALEQELAAAHSPSPATAARRLALSLVPAGLRRRVREGRARRA